MTNPADALFERLRSLVLATFPSAVPAFTDKAELVPIEGTADGEWICMSSAGEVGLLDASGHFDPHIAFAVSKTALIGSLAQRVPLATWFVPKAASPRVCPACEGRGRVNGVPSELAETIRCQCGGLGWLAAEASPPR
jgi:hypothetical protein